MDGDDELAHSLQFCSLPAPSMYVANVIQVVQDFSNACAQNQDKARLLGDGSIARSPTRARRRGEGQSVLDQTTEKKSTNNDYVHLKGVSAADLQPADARSDRHKRPSI